MRSLSLFSYFQVAEPELLGVGAGGVALSPFSPFRPCTCTNTKTKTNTKTETNTITRTNTKTKTNKVLHTLHTYPLFSYEVGVCGKRQILEQYFDKGWKIPTFRIQYS